MRLLLDTNVLIAYERKNAAAIALVNRNDCITSAIAVLEFDQFLPVQKGKRKPFLEIFPTIQVLTFDTHCATIAASQVQQFRALRTPKGKPAIDENRLIKLTLDTMIAATGIANHVCVVTDNKKDFSIYAGLKFQTLNVD